MEKVLLSSNPYVPREGLNAFDIINSVSGDNNFITFQKGIIAIAVTLLGLFAITRFAKKIIDPEESQSSENIIKNGETQTWTKDDMNEFPKGELEIKANESNHEHSSSHHVHVVLNTGVN